MKYSKVYIEGLGYTLAPEVVTSDELEVRLAPLYNTLKIPAGQLEALTGIAERRWWPVEHRLSDAAISAGRMALAESGVRSEDLGAVVYAGVCRELYEPATACRVAHELGAPADAAIYDISNACLGVMTGMIEIANRIELGQIRAGLVVACESAREIVELTIARVLEEPTMPAFTECLATLTGGSGAAAVLLTDGSFGSPQGVHQLLGGVELSDAAQHDLCRWGVTREAGSMRKEFMLTDAVGVLEHGVKLGTATWGAFLKNQGWTVDAVDKVICHQVAASNQEAILAATGIAREKDFTSFAYLGNMGTVSLPTTAALASERGFLEAGDQVAFLGIGSGLNCLMLGLRW
jgi:3-oxoacyl-[acyl-carrier-protein] synthase III